VCSACAEPVAADPKVLADLGFTPEQMASAKLMKGRGCKTCNGSGYKGRVALYEVMRFTDNLREMVLQGASTAELKAAAVKQGMITLRAAGNMKIAQGVTTPEEVLRVTMSD
jgi:type IV pilus assembly protein PilB